MMRRNWIAGLLALVMVLSLTGCGGGEETTVTGMVVSLDGTVVSLMEMSGSMEGFGGGRPSGFENGEMPSRPEGEGPEGMEDFTIPEDFNFDPDKMPQGFDGENRPEGFDPGSFEGMPQGEGRPQMPGGGEFPGFESMGETTTVDIANARIGVENDGVKESCSMENIVPGAFVTITISPKGEATYVLVTSTFGFGNFMPQT